MYVLINCIFYPYPISMVLNSLVCYEMSWHIFSIKNSLQQLSYLRRGFLFISKKNQIFSAHIEFTCTHIIWTAMPSFYSTDTGYPLIWIQKYIFQSERKRKRKSSSLRYIISLILFENLQWSMFRWVKAFCCWRQNSLLETTKASSTQRSRSSLV